MFLNTSDNDRGFICKSVYIYLGGTLKELVDKDGFFGRRIHS